MLLSPGQDTTFSNFLGMWGGGGPSSTLLYSIQWLQGSDRLDPSVKNEIFHLKIIVIMDVHC